MPPPEDAQPGSMKRFLFTGLAAILPTLLIVLILVKGFDLVHALAGEHVADLLFNTATPRFWQRLTADLVALAGLVALMLGAGLLVGSVFGRHILEAGEHLLLRLPIVKGIYPALRQLTDFMVSNKTAGHFRNVVAIPYPHPGIYSIGFVTGDGVPEVNAATGKPMLSVFVPSSPAPFTGWICLVPKEQAVPLRMTVEEALRYCISVGVSHPVAPPPGSLPPAKA